jgi:hypothetical protein
MKYAYFTIHPGKNPRPQNGCRLKSIFLSTGFTSSTFPIQPKYSQYQPTAITLNTGSPRHWTWHQNGKRKEKKNNSFHYIDYPNEVVLLLWAHNAITI